jgi:polar amino acid transport system permease protein
MNWTRQYPGWAMFAAMIGLLVFLWGMALPLAAAPAPIGPAAEQFADGARITVGLTLIAGIAGVVIGVLAGLGKLSRFWPLRWLCDSYVWLIRGTPLLLQILFVWLAFPRSCRRASSCPTLPVPRLPCR